MYEGKSSRGIEFFNLLMDSKEFSQELGQVTLVAGRLEAELIQLYQRKDFTNNFSKSPLGKLIQFGEKNSLLNGNLVEVLKMTCNQRNYITHNIYALFSDMIDETLLSKSDLIDTDVFTYKEKVWETKNNLIHLADIVREI